MLYRTLDRVNVRHEPNFASPVCSFLPAGIEVAVSEVRVITVDTWACVGSGLWCPISYSVDGRTRQLMVGTTDEGCAPVLLKLDKDSSEQVVKIIKAHGMVMAEKAK